MFFKTLASSFLLSAALVGVAHAAGPAATPSPADAATSSSAPAQPTPITRERTFGKWEVVCSYKPSARSASLCILNQARDQYDMLALSRIADDTTPITAQPYIISIFTPLGYDLAQRPVLSIGDSQPVRLTYMICEAPRGCMAGGKATPDIVAAIRTAKTLHVSVSRIPTRGGDAVTVEYDMHHFSKAFDTAAKWATEKAPA